MMRDDTRPDVDCESPEDAFPRDAYYVGEGVPPPPPGWRRAVIPRKTVQGADAYYYSPCGKRMRSKPDVQRFLDKKREEGKYTDVSIESFDFSTGAKAIKPPKEDAKKGDEKPAKRAKKEEKKKGAGPEKKEDAAAAKEDDAGKEEAGADPAAETAEKSGDDVQDDAAPEGDVEMKD